MRVEPRSPQALPSRWHHGPIHHYHVIFWRQPHVPPEQLPEGVTQDRVMWAANENDMLDVRDVVEAVRWAEEEARRRGAIFTLYAVMDRGGQEGQLWLAGWNPTVHSRPNYEDRQPTDVNPSTGTVTEVFRKPGE